VSAGGLQNYGSYGMWAVSIWATSPVICEQWFGTVSDIRIKTNIQPVNSMLDTINKIEIVSFDFIDPTKHKRDECGVIAQQLKTVFPNAVDYSTGIIPCYIVHATYTDNGDNLTILFENKDEPLKVGDKIDLKLGVYHEEKEKSKDEGEKMVEVLKVIEGGFVCKKWENYVESDIIVYGKHVDDFHNVDKEQLGILALKGVQELSVIIKQQQTIIEKQANEISLLKQNIADINTNLNSHNTLLSQIVDKLSALNINP
jgi:hypothetical protein